MTVSKQDTDRRVGTVVIREPVSTVLRESAAMPLVALDGGWFLMGSDDSYIYEEDGEGPVRRVRVEPFYLSACCVSNE